VPDDLQLPLKLKGTLTDFTPPNASWVLHGLLSVEKGEQGVLQRNIDVI
jgi:hypothetical protein